MLFPHSSAALTPPMGWNSYDYYDTTVTEADVRANAEVLARELKPYGWEYVVVDIQWYAKDAGARRAEFQYIPFGDHAMDEYGRFQPDPARFPSAAGGRGFGPLADYVHSLGLKFGIHIMRGIPRAAAHRRLPVHGTPYTAADLADPSSICRWNPDMYGVRAGHPGAQAYYDDLIAMYAAWGVDFIKCDDIANTNMYPHAPYSGRAEIEYLHNAILHSGRDIVLSLSPGPALIEQAWHYAQNANMWRITDDLWINGRMCARCSTAASSGRTMSRPGLSRLRHAAAGAHRPRFRRRARHRPDPRRTAHAGELVVPVRLAAHAGGRADPAGRIYQKPADQPRGAAAAAAVLPRAAARQRRERARCGPAPARPGRTASRSGIWPCSTSARSRARWPPTPPPCPPGRAPPPPPQPASCGPARPCPCPAPACLPPSRRTG